MALGAWHPPVRQREEANLRLDSVTALSNKLKAAGVDPDSLGIQYVEEGVFYPGGFYTNKLISANIGGQTESFDAALVLRNPEVTTTEILRFLSGLSGQTKT